MIVRRLASLLLLLVYPPRFRADYGDDYVAAAEHRFTRNLEGASRVGAVGRTVFLLVVDALRTAPGLWLARTPGRHAPVRPKAPYLAWVGGAFADARFAVRALLRRPGFAALVVLTLGLGIGASTAVFRALDRVILRPLPYSNGERMVYVLLEHRQRGWQIGPWQAYVDAWRDGAATLERIEVYRHASMVRTGHGSAELVNAVAVSGGLPGMLGVRPLVGRMLGPADADPAQPPVVLLSERYWHRAFGGDPAAVGATLHLDDTLFTVAGVWPEAARLDYDRRPDLFRVVPPDREAPRGDLPRVLALARPGVTSAEIESDLRGLSNRVEDASVDWAPAVKPNYGFLGADYVRGLWAALGGAVVLLLVAVVNAVNLMLSRVSARGAEVGMRVALGGTGVRLARLFFAESALLAAAGLAIGAGVAVSLGTALAAIEPARAIPAAAAGLDDRAVLFAGLLAAVAALVCAAAPILHLRAADVRTLIQGMDTRAAARSSRFRAVLVASQAALAVVLVVGAALLGRSFAALTRVESGMDLERLAVVAVESPRSRYPSGEEQLAFAERVRRELGTIPGVQGVAAAPSPPLRFSINGGEPYVVGEPEPEPTSGRAAFVSTAGAEPGYFQVMGIPLIQGRQFTRGDETDAVIVNQAFADRYGGDVVGRRLRFAGREESMRIVGVVGNVRSAGLDDAADRVQLYYPHAPDGGYSRFVLRTDGSPETALRLARARIAAIDPDVPIREATTGPALKREETAETRFLALLLAGFAAFGLVFALAGVYGAVSLDVQCRRREIGIRMAVGATGSDVIRAVLRRGLGPVAVGGAAGIAIALWGGPQLEGLLFGVPARDPWSAGAAALLLAMTAVAGCVLPARRASRVDPGIALQAK